MSFNWAYKIKYIILIGKVSLLWALTVITQSELVKKTKEYGHCECDLYTCPPITTSHWRTEAHIVCLMQLLRGRQSFCISPSSVRKRIWYWFPQTLTNSCSWVSFTHSTYPTHVPHYISSISPSLHVPPTFILPPAYTQHMPFSIPPCGHLNCPCWGVGSISIFTPSPPCFHLGRQCYASFICRAGWPIFSVWPHAAIVHRCSILSCCSCTGPRQQLWVWQPGWIRMGTAGTDWLPFKVIYLGCLEHCEVQNQNDKTKPYCTVKETEVAEWARTGGMINILKFHCLGRVAPLDMQCYWI